MARGKRQRGRIPSNQLKVLMEAVFRQGPVTSGPAVPECSTEDSESIVHAMKEGKQVAAGSRRRDVGKNIWDMAIYESTENALK
jgi:hypothetical protein